MRPIVCRRPSNSRARAHLEFWIADSKRAHRRLIEPILARFEFTTSVAHIVGRNRAAECIVQNTRLLDRRCNFQERVLRLKRESLANNFWWQKQYLLTLWRRRCCACSPSLKRFCSSSSAHSSGRIGGRLLSVGWSETWRTKSQNENLHDATSKSVLTITSFVLSIWRNWPFFFSCKTRIVVSTAKFEHQHLHVHTDKKIFFAYVNFFPSRKRSHRVKCLLSAQYRA